MNAPAIRTLLLVLASGPFAPEIAFAEPPSLQSVIGSPENFRISGSVRLRYESLDGQPRAGFRAEDEQLALRTILSAAYGSGPVRVSAELHDSRAWLHQDRSPISSNEINTLELVQANLSATINDPFGKNSRLDLQAGRMTIGLGSRRLVAADDYRNATNGYTGLRLDMKTAGGLAATAIYVLPHIRLPDDLTSLRAQRSKWDRESFDMQLFGGLVSKRDAIGTAMLEAGYFGLRERDWEGHLTRDRHLDNFSTRLIRDPAPSHFDFELEAIYQTGTIRTRSQPSAPLQSVSASLVHADAGYTFAAHPKLRVSIEFDRATGDAPGGKYGRFDTLFGMRGADFAQSGIYNAVGRTNITSVGFRVELPLTHGWEAYATYRPMWLTEPTDSFSTTGVVDPTGASGDFAGHQIELQVRYWLVPKLLRAQINALWLGKGRFLRSAPNAVTPHDTQYLATTLSLQL